MTPWWDLGNVYGLDKEFAYSLRKGVVGFSAPLLYTFTLLATPEPLCDCAEKVRGEGGGVVEFLRSSWEYQKRGWKSEDGAVSQEKVWARGLGLSC